MLGSACASVLRQWLSASGSLSRRLAALGQRFEVQTLWQGPARLHRSEAVALGAQARGRHWVREVLLRIDGRAVVWARSVASRRSLAGPWRALLGLGSRPLADLLFNEPRVTRTPLVRERVPRAGLLHTRLARQWHAATGMAPPRGMVRARSSVFRKYGAPLRVLEVFTPMLAAVRPARLRPGAAAMHRRRP